MASFAIQRILNHLPKKVIQGDSRYTEHSQWFCRIRYSVKFIVHRPLRDQQREPVMTDSSYGRRAAALTRSLGVEPSTIVSTVYTLALSHELGDAGLLELAVVNALDFVYHVRQLVLELSSDSTICKQGPFHQL